MAAAPLRLAALAAVLVLASCGGGGDGSSSTPTTGTTPTGSGSNGSAAAGASYAAGSPQAAAFQRLNAARAQCGFGTLAQSSELDKSASAHANYMALNNSYDHAEVPGRPGFTGVNLGERETAAGYRFGFAGEALAQVSSGSGTDAMRELLAAPYHAILLLNSFRDIGIGWSSVGGVPTLTMDLGTRLGQSLPQPGGVLTYPCNGITDAVPVGGNETPSPFPPDPSARWGQPVTVRGPADLVLTSAAITGPLGSVQVQAIYGEGQAADPNGTGDFTRGSFTLIPAPLQPNTSYAVTVAYRTGGAEGRSEFTFTTAGR